MKNISLIFLGFISSFLVMLYVRADNVITSLDTPTNLSWKENSTATAKWDSVSNANYYMVNVYVHDENNNYINMQETGTTDIEIDLQQEINNILINNNVSNINKLYYYFDVRARYFDDNIDVVSDVSTKSNAKIINNTGKTIVQTPTNLTLNDDKTLSFKSVDAEKIERYMFYYKITYNDNNKIAYGYEQIYKKDLSKSGDIYTGDVSKVLKYAYDDAGYDGETVEISLKMAPAGITYSYSDNYKLADNPYQSFSDFSNSISYVGNGKIIVQTPTDLVLHDDKTLSFKSPNGDVIDHYMFYYKITYNDSNKIAYGYELLFKKNLTKSGDIYTGDVSKVLKYAYDDAGYDGETVEISLKMAPGEIVYSYSDRYKLASNPYNAFSSFSNSISYVGSAKIIVQTPTNLVLHDNKTLSFKSPNADVIEYYMFYYSIKYGNNNRIAYGHELLYKKNLTKSGDIYTGDVSKVLKYDYEDAGYSNQTVEIALKIAPASIVYSYSDNYRLADDKYKAFSEYSNFIFYNPNGSTIINNITLSPNTPIIAIGRSIYIGKTIQPENAYYSFINWSTSNESIVDIDSMGKITGNSVGNATITAKINNATQTANVSVYRIESNFNNSSKQNVIDKANDIIENIIIDSNVEGTNIDNVNDAIAEIEDGAQNGNIFNVDININEKNKNQYLSIEDGIYDKHSDMTIAGGYDVSVEIFHKDNQNQKHHIGDILEFDDEVLFEMNLIDLPTLSETKHREYVLMRYHNGELEDINMTLSNNKIITSSNSFSDFILLYKDIDIPVESINADKDNVSIIKGKTETISIIVSPNNAANKNYISTSNNDNVATVNGNIITAIDRGTATITFETEDGHFTKQVNVTVIDPKVLSITTDEDDYSINLENKTFDIDYNVQTQDNPEYVIEFISSDSNIVDVNNNGKVTMKKPGDATITIKAGGVEKTVNVTVYSLIKAVNLSGIIKPIMGQTPSTNTIASSTVGITVKSANWYEDVEDWQSKEPVDVFEKDKNYILRIEFSLDDNYMLSDEFDENSIVLNALCLKSEFLKDSREVRIYYKSGLPAITIAPKIKVNNSNNNSLLISWNDNPAVEKYIVYRSENNKKWKTLKTVTTNNYTDTGLIYGKKYYYKVKAINSISNKTSSVVSGKTVPNKINLKITSAGTNNIKLSWDKVSVTGYEVYRGTKTSNMKKIKTITKNSTISLNNTKLKANTTYYYKVRAYKTVNGKKIYGSWSTILSTRTAPVKPSLSLSMKDLNVINIKIGSTKGATRYVIDKSLDGKTYTRFEDSSNYGTFVDTDLELGKVYYYRITACNSQNRCSSWVSGSIKSTTRTPGLSLATSSKKVTITVGTVNGATGYEIYRATKKNGKYSLMKTLSDESELLQYVNSTKKGYTYYYKVRAFITLEDGKKLYTSYSGIKSIKSK